MASRVPKEQTDQVTVRAPTPAAKLAPPYTLRGWRALDVVARGLMLARMFRSVAQGALVVAFVLYLDALGWSAGAIGALVGAAGVVGAALMLIAGPLSDRFGRRPFLVWYEIASAAGAMAVVLSPHAWVLVLVAVLLGYGRGANGAAGPFSPVEQAWLAASVPARARSQVFSLNAALGFAGMGLGTLAAVTVPFFARIWPGPAAYEPLFVLNLVLSLASMAAVLRLREVPATTGQAQATEAVPASDVTRRENVAMVLLTVVNSVNAIGVGLIGPLLPYWFARRFGVGPEAIGAVYALTFFLTAVSSVLTGEVGARLGVVRSVVAPRFLGVLTLIAMPLMPVYALAAGLYTVRSVLNRGTAGTRQAFSVGLVRDHRRGLASSLNALSFRLPSALGAAGAGWLMGMGRLDLPLYLSAGFQATYVVLFAIVLGRYENGT